MTRSLFFLLWLGTALLRAPALRAQILDDSTRQVYGPQTTRYFLEADLFNGIDTLYTVDTLFLNHDRFEFAERGPTQYQNLGDLGTPLNPFFPQLPDRPGVRFGYDAFTPYAADPARVRYYNTRSPYSYLDYVQGSQGQQILRAAISWNVDPRFNFGIDLQRISSDKQIGGIISEDPASDHYAVVGYASYRSENERYALLTNFTHFNHRFNATGGVLPGEGDTRDDLFDFDAEQVRLGDGTQSLDNRNQFHLYQQYRLLGNGVQVYHRLDRQRARFAYTDPNTPTTDGEDFYPNRFFSATTAQEDRFELYENTVGFKGRLSRAHYGLFLLRRDFFREGTFVTFAKGGNETYAGGTLQYFFTDTSYVSTFAQYSLGADYLLRAEVRHRWLTAEQRRIRYSPTLVQQGYAGNHFLWTNNFEATVADRTYARATLPLGPLTLRPYVDFVSFQNYIYFGQQAQPAQEADRIQSLGLGLSLTYRLGRFTLTGDARRTDLIGGASGVLRVPPWLAFGRLYYQNALFGDALRLQVGLEGRFRGGYLADDYMPATGQFFLQDNFPVEDYGWGDLFLNLGISRAIVFVKFTHLNEGLGRPGYFVAPFYPGTRRLFIFGVKWQFYD